jgi:hypothetical protein
MTAKAASDFALIDALRSEKSHPRALGQLRRRWRTTDQELARILNRKASPPD